MVYAMHTAHWEINTRALNNVTYMKMGTTLVVAVLRDDKAYIVNAGDSRCYLFQRALCPDSGRNTFKRLTHDHTVGDQLLACGISIGEIPKKQFHTLTQSIGCGDPPYPDFNIVEVKRGNVLLICSDGLTDMLTDSEIEAILAIEGASLETLTVRLVDAANANGGRDNISVVLVQSP
jgi:protein phosphatase